MIIYFSSSAAPAHPSVFVASSSIFFMLTGWLPQRAHGWFQLFENPLLFLSLPTTFLCRRACYLTSSFYFGLYLLDLVNISTVRHISLFFFFSLFQLFFDNLFNRISFFLFFLQKESDSGNQFKRRVGLNLLFAGQSWITFVILNNSLTFSLSIYLENTNLLSGALRQRVIFSTSAPKGFFFFPSSSSLRLESLQSLFLLPVDLAIPGQKRLPVTEETDSRQILTSVSALVQKHDPI